MTAREDLAIVIPVWNLPEDLSTLLDQISAMRVFAEVVVSDDASDQDCHPKSLGFSEDRLGARLVYLRSEKQRGAGHARNAGLRAVTTRNVLFFDADDQLTDGFPKIWQRHVGGGVPDFTIFRHSDTRVLSSEGREGSFRKDERIWDRALGAEKERFLSLRERAHLSAISAYPWNKIYRTDFLREANITCSETPVHNDIRLHWLSFARAGSVQALREIGAVHVVGDRGHHLTTRRGADRLCLGGIIEGLTREIRATRGSAVIMRHFIHFVDTICRWSLDQVDEDLKPKFKDIAIRSYLGFTPEEFQLFAQWQPERADAVVQFLLAEGA